MLDGSFGQHMHRRSFLRLALSSGLRARHHV